ncbi:hypothetical protein [Synechococcus sp. A15-60]|uniref:hypothetical protein n=1 Tax=Synechococcus sp. A15-60 TaxID=1050655 RepID=UPI001644CC95|nr:hypothetical protein [Synechococcus sp. A15-60]
MRRWLPMLFPLAVLLIGSWRLASNSSTPTPVPVMTRPDLSVSPPGTYATCTQDPALDKSLLSEGRRLGVAVKAGEPELPGKDATYRAEPGRLGTITLKQRPMSDEVRCLLISHEFIHVLQHLHGDLKGVSPLGWPVSPQGIERFGAVQEAEAYRYQNNAGYVLMLLRNTPTPTTAD